MGGASNKKKVQEYTTIDLQCLNVDGLNHEKLALLEDYCIEERPDILALQETKFTVESLPPNLDIEGYNHYVTERSEQDKKGGGLILYYKTEIPVRTWTRPGKNKSLTTANEYQWIMIETKTSKMAIANVYFACQSSKNRNYLEWNTEMYNELKADIEVLRDLNFAIFMMGDFNGWTGKQPGMENNNDVINENGKLLLDFIAEEELYMMNRLNKKGKVFTREHYSGTGRLLSQSCLDYALIAKEAKVGSWSFNLVDAKDDLGINTDHKLLKITGEVNIIRRKKCTKKNIPSFNNEELREVYKRKVRQCLRKKNRKAFQGDNTTLQIQTLHNVILEASNATVGKKKTHKKRQKRRISHHTKKLLHEKRLIQEEIKETGRTQDLIQDLVVKKQEIKDSILNGLVEHRRKVRLELALKDPNKKVFWRLTKRSAGKDQGITAVWGPDKKIIFDPPKVKKAVYDSFKGRLNGREEAPQPVKKKHKKASKLGKKLSKPVSRDELKKVIAQIKKEKAPGPFGIHGEHIIYGGFLLQEFIRDWLNNMLKTGEVPEILKQGRVSLLYKRGDCLDPANYRPITISSVMMKVLTRLLNIRLEEVVEENKFLSEKQFGFRKKYSTTDAVLVVSAAIDKARLDNLDAGMASIDLKAAYDMVSREALFAKLESLGLNGSFLQLIEDYYTGDSVVYAVGDGVTKPLYMTQGVKQGCNLSPMLFNLFLVDMINKVHEMKLGIKLGPDIITIISYADDIIAFAKCIDDLKLVIKCITDECNKINMKVSVTKSQILRVGHSVRTYDNIDDDLLDFDQVLKCKYLGVVLENRTGIYYGEFAKACVKKAKAYKFAIMRKAKDSHDPIRVAQELWNKAAIPGILYGCEVLPIRKQELRMLNSEAASLGKFILQIPKNSTNVTAHLVGGIEAVEYYYYKRVLGYRARVQKMDNERLAHRVYNFIMSSNQNFGYKRCHESLERMLNGKSLAVWYTENINRQRDLHVTSCFILPVKLAPEDGLRLRFHAHDEISKIYTEFVTMNAGLGNRGPVKGFKQHKQCQLCLKRNKKEKLNEQHILFECEQLRRLQHKYGLIAYKQASGQLDVSQIYKNFWLDDLPSGVILGRVESADAIRNVYINVMKTILRP